MVSILFFLTEMQILTKKVLREGENCGMVSKFLIKLCLIKFFYNYEKFIFIGSTCCAECI